MFAAWTDSVMDIVVRDTPATREDPRVAMSWAILLIVITLAMALLIVVGLMVRNRANARSAACTVELTCPRCGTRDYPQTWSEINPFAWLGILAGPLVLLIAVVVCRNYYHVCRYCKMRYD